MNDNQRLTEAAASCSLDEQGTALSSYMKELKTRLVDLIEEEEEEGKVRYLGGSVADGLYKDEDVAVARSIMTEGTTLVEHTHEKERMWIIVVTGAIDVTIEDDRRRFIGGTSIIIGPRKRHSIDAVEDSVLIAVTIPAEEAMPDPPVAVTEAAAAPVPKVGA